MKIPRSLHRVGLALLALAILAIPGYWYLSAERLRLDEAHTRELAHLAHDLETTLAGEIDAATRFFQSNTPKKYSEAESKSFVERNPYLLGAAPGGALPEQRERVCAAASPVELDVWTGGNTGSLEFALDGAALFHDVVIDETFEYLFVAAGGWIDAKGANSPNSAEKPAEGGNGSSLEPDAERAGAGAEDGTGRVVFDMAHGTLSGHWRDLGFLGQRALGGANTYHPAISLRDVTGLIDEQTQQQLKVTALARNSGRYSVRLGNDSYQLFSYPITVLRRRPGAADCSTAEYTWIVGGFVDPSRTWREAATVAPHSTLSIIIVLLLIVALQPLFKLFLLNPSERFRFADACMLAANATLVLTATTVLLLESGAYSDLQKLADSGLETLASVVQKKLIGEFRSMRAELVNFTNRLPNCDVSSLEDRKDLLVSDPPYLREPPRAYPYLVQITYIDPRGSQIFKATVNPQLTPRLSVQGRTYFTEASYRAPQYLWSFSDDQPGTAVSPPFFVQSTRSWTTSDLSTDLSISLRNKFNRSETAKTCDGYVAEISAPLLAVERPLLASGYEFAVISADGQVLYHSDPRRTLKENLLEEVEDADDLHAAILSRTQRHLKTLYGGRPTELFVRPLDLRNANWFIVTLRDPAWIYAATTDALFHASALCCISWLGLTLCLLAPLLLIGTRSLPAIWPASGKARFYRDLTGVYAALLSAGVAGVVFLNAADTGLLWLSVLFPLAVGVTTLVMHLAHRHAVRPPGSGAPTGAASRSCWAWYVAALVALWVSAGAVPAAGIFRHSWQLEMRKLERFEQIRYQRSVNDWDAEDRDYYRKREIAFGAPSERNRMLEHRSADRTSFSVRYAQGGFLVSPLEEWLDRHLPFYSEPIESVRYQRPGVEAGRSSQHPVDSDQSTASPARGSSILLLALFALAGALCFRFTLRSLFWPGLPRHATRIPPAQGGCPYALLLVPTSRQKRTLKEWFQPAAGAVAMQPGAPQPFVTPGNGVEVFDFEDEWSETGRRQRMLESLEAAPAGARALILAESDPVLMLTGKAKNNGHSLPFDVTAAERERWMTLFRPLRAVRHPVVRENGSEDGHFNVLWKSCSPVEQLTLLHVAQEGFANRHHGDTLRRLLDKGLLDLDPHLKLAIPGWREFVAQQAAPAEVEGRDQDRGKLAWRTIRWAFLFLLVIAMLFAFVTGASWIKSATGMMTVLGGIMETVWKVLSAAHRIGAPEGE